MTVNGLGAAVSAPAYLATGIPLRSGANVLTVTASGPGGSSRTITRLVTSDGQAPGVELTAAPAAGPTPLAVTFTYQLAAPLTIQTVAMDWDGDGQIDFTTTDPAAPLTHTYPAHGVFAPGLVIVAAEGTVESSATVEVQDPVAMDTLFRAMWDGMNAALVQGNTTQALGYLTVEVQEKFAEDWEALLPQMPQIVQSMVQFTGVAMGGDLAHYAVVRDIDGANQIFLVTFVRDGDGVWRIGEM